MVKILLILRVYHISRFNVILIHVGYNCSLFAYGQTGSGKSYSMVGYGPNK